MRSHAHPWFSERRWELAVAEFDRRQWESLTAPWSFGDGPRYTVQRIFCSAPGWSCEMVMS